MVPQGHHPRSSATATRYRTDFEAVVVALAGDRTLRASVERPADRLASMWGEVRREAGR